MTYPNPPQQGAGNTNNRPNGEFGGGGGYKPGSLGGCGYVGITFTYP